MNAKGIELVDLALRRGRGRSMLQFLVDEPGGITLEKCAQLNKQIGEMLEKDDVIQESYILEVSSPGLDRPLISTRDFQRCADKEIRIVLHEAINKQNVWKGTMAAIDEENVTIKTSEEKKVVINRENIAKARLELEL